MNQSKISAAVILKMILKMMSMSIMILFGIPLLLSNFYAYECQNPHSCQLLKLHNNS
jgi:hypothetical protein